MRKITAEYIAAQSDLIKEGNFCGKPVVIGRFNEIMEAIGLAFEKSSVEESPLLSISDLSGALSRMRIENYESGQVIFY